MKLIANGVTIRTNQNARNYKKNLQKIKMVIKGPVNVRGLILRNMVVAKNRLRQRLLAVLGIKIISNFPLVWMVSST